MSDELTIRAGGQTISGWSEVRVTRGIERVVSDFEIAMTERYPAAEDVVVGPGQECEIYLGDDLVLTGYIDRYMPEFDAHRHTVRVAGRSKTQDMVDCAAVWPGSQVVNGTVLQIAESLLGPFGISAYALDDVGPVFPKVALNMGDTVFEVLEPYARIRALLMYDDVYGNVVFSRVSDKKAASGFREGQNVEAAGIAYSMDQRFSDYAAFRVKASALNDGGNEANLISDEQDQTVPRYRPMFFVAETNDGGYDVAKRRAIWEKNRRAGRSQAVHVVCDSWRDASGALWTPNTLATVNLPGLKLPSVEWTISEVTYIRNAGGTHAQVVLMPPGTFAPQPSVLPYSMALALALQEAMKNKAREEKK